MAIDDSRSTRETGDRRLVRLKRRAASCERCDLFARATQTVFGAGPAGVQPRAILALGGIAMRAYLGLLKERGAIQSAAAYRFAHGASYALPGGLPRLFASYHPSQQNTFTGKLTPAMLARVLRDIRRFLEKDSAP